MHYFKHFPRILYTLPETGKAMSVIDITRRFTIGELARNASLVFYSYSIQEGDRPDIIAHKYYKDSTLDWLVLIANEIHNPYFQWYMNTTEFNTYIRQKYGSVEAALRTNHHYELVTQTASRYTDDEGVTIQIPKKTLIIDRTTYDATSAADRIAVDCYTHESNLNEKTRDISLVDRKYLSFLLEQYKDLFV